MVNDTISEVGEYESLFTKARLCVGRVGNFVSRFYREEPTIRLRRIYKQPDDYSCGATSLKTLMEHYDQEADLDDLIKRSQTTKQGTPIENLALVAEQFGFRTVVKRDASIVNLERSLRSGRIPLVGYLVMDEDTPDPHYSLVLEVRKQEVLIADSRTGSTYTVGINEFLKGWGNDKPPWTMMTIRR